MYDLISYTIYLLILSLNFLAIFLTFNKCITRKEITLYILINTLVDLIIVHIDKEFLLLPVSSLILFYFCNRNLKNIYNSIFIVILTDLIFAVSDAVTGFFASLFFHINFNTITINSISYFILALTITGISFLISIVIRKIFKRLNIYGLDISEKLKGKLPLILYIGFFLISIYVNIYEYKYFVKNISSSIINLNAFSIISNFIIVIFLFNMYVKNIRNKLQQEYKDKELEQLSEYTNMIEAISDDLRRFKHDYANILQVLESYIDAKDMDGLEKFYHKELEPESKKIMNKNSSIYLLKHIKINSLKGLISSKIYTANLSNINTYIEIPEDITDLAVNELDISRIIGILFDNAIEAALLSEEKSINFAIINRDTYTSFIISNSCPENTPSIDQIYEKNFSTKGAGRGIGLKSVRKLINEKYANIFLHTKVKNSIFRQELVIKNS